MITDTLKRVGFGLATLVFASPILGAAFFGLTRLLPRHDDTPQIVARHDEKVAVAPPIAAPVAAPLPGDASFHIDLTTKEIRDAYQALPAPQPTVGSQSRPLPSASVGRMRDRLNEGIARANRAAGPADAPD